MSNVFFQPFVGKDYAKGGIFGKCIMILGESHYCEGCLDCGIQLKHPECMDFTQGVRIPVDTRSLIPVISVHSISNLQYRWQS